MCTDVVRRGLCMAPRPIISLGAVEGAVCCVLMEREGCVVRAFEVCDKTVLLLGGCWGECDGGQGAVSKCDLGGWTLMNCGEGTFLRGGSVGCVLDTFGGRA